MNDPVFWIADSQREGLKAILYMRWVARNIVDMQIRYRIWLDEAEEKNTKAQEEGKRDLKSLIEAGSEITDLRERLFLPGKCVGVFTMDYSIESTPVCDEIYERYPEFGNKLRDEKLIKKYATRFGWKGLDA